MRRAKAWHVTAAAADPLYREHLSRVLLTHRPPPPHGNPESPGHVVEFLKAGRPVCGALMRRGSRADWILDVHGKEDHVDHEKVVDVSPAFVGSAQARYSIVEQLRAIDQERRRLKDSINPYELWEVVQPEGREWSLHELAALYFADDPGPHGKAALFRALEDGRAFCRRGKSFLPLKPELVAQHKAEDQRAHEAEAWLREAAAWLRHLANGAHATPPPSASRALELLAAKVLFGARHPQAQLASALAHLAHFRSEEALFDVLVKAGHWSRDENLELLRRQVPTAFPQQAIAEAEAADWLPAGSGARRVWLRRVFSFAGAKGRHERAISIRPALAGFAVGLHFASPALLLRRDGLLQQAAAERAAALRLPDRFVPLLPEALTGKAALTEGALKPCLTLDLRFDRSFRLQSWRFGIRRVRVTCSFSLPEAQAQAARDWGLRKLLGLAQRLRQQRLAAGAVLLLKPEVEVRVRNGQVELLRSVPDEPARVLEQEFSILANTLAGRFCAEHGLPALYRVEEPCSEVFVAPGQYDPVACYRQERAMPRARLETRPAPHHGLGVETYVPISASGARYTDLLMHQQIVDFLTAGQPGWSVDGLNQALLYTTTARESAHEIEEASRRYWLLRYLEGKAGAAQEAVVLERLDNGCLVELSETGLRGFCLAKPSAGLVAGACVRIKLTHVSARAESLHLEIAGSP